MKSKKGKQGRKVQAARPEECCKIKAEIAKLCWCFKKKSFLVCTLSACLQNWDANQQQHMF
ncbi:CLUMA_CG007942, isoform A [Clunio marinus]|uniref:CLUMA_CG007942, isoform A n=1 Tax=Clunio marinus TaxID=568069 RepID=A0A1J1I2K6_9DIPT|nr:CLUMA_CG007942, isoform A [Clunio marinus]